MNIAFFSINKSFCRFILEELGRHHTVKVWERNPNEWINKTNMLKLLDWCDLAYLEWLQTENLELTQINEIDKPVVAFCHGVDIFNHDYVNWNNIDGLIIQDSAYPVLIKLRVDWNRMHPDLNLPSLPKKILVKSIGVDLNAFTPLPQSPEHPPIPEYHIVTHATVVRSVKRIYEAIQQFYDLIQLDGDKPWKMTLIGEWTSPNLLDDDYPFACKDLIDRYAFPAGRMHLKTLNFPPKIWAKFAQTADIYWCTSWRESFGASMAEICASGGYPFVNWYLGADKVYPRKYLCKTSGEMVRKTIEWGNLSQEEKVKERGVIRKHIEQYDARKAAKDIRLFVEEVAELHRR